MSHDANPFPAGDGDRHAIWEMLVARDVQAFVQQNWASIEPDFDAEAFFGIDARNRDNPDMWRAGFASLAQYRDTWLEQARRFAPLEDRAALRSGLFDATVLRDIEIEGDVAIAHKKFDGWLPLPGGATERILWQTLYVCRRYGESWRIVSFVGYLPNPMGRVDAAEAGRRDSSAKVLPAGASQHSTAGPYSPVLRVNPSDLVVLSGQAAIGADGAVIGDTVEEQTRVTLANCEAQLASAGCTLADVFKVNVYLTDLEDWKRFNDVYREAMPAPQPVRTAVGTALLPGLLVEVEMWAARS